MTVAKPRSSVRTHETHTTLRTTTGPREFLVLISRLRPGPASVTGTQSSQIPLCWYLEYHQEYVYVSVARMHALQHKFARVFSGIARAPSWRGPYSMASAFGGPISNAEYPYEENEDPFLFKTKRGFHALFHANTWGDSRGSKVSVGSGAGRLAYSADGVTFEFARTPSYNGT